MRRGRALAGRKSSDALSSHNRTVLGWSTPAVAATRAAALPGDVAGLQQPWPVVSGAGATKRAVGVRCEAAQTGKQHTQKWSRPGAGAAAKAVGSER